MAERIPATIPPALLRVGITEVSDNLPAGAGIDLARDFVRIFKPEIEARLRRPAPAKTAEGGE